jgi:hypothetical protein
MKQLGVNLEMPKLNKKQKEFLRHLRNIELRPFATFNPYDLSNTAQLTLMILDTQGWLFDDFVGALKQFFNDLEHEQE